MIACSLAKQSVYSSHYRSHDKQPLFSLNHQKLTFQTYFLQTPMVTLRFPFSFPHPLKPPLPHHHASSFSAAAFLATGAGVGLSVALRLANPQDPFVNKAFGFFSFHAPSLAWASLSMANPGSDVVEANTGVAFPAFLEDGRRLLGTGLRRRSIMGLKYIDDYAFGVYVDEKTAKNILDERHKDGMNFCKEMLEEDLGMTLRFQIVNARLSSSSIRTSFEESVGSRLRKFGGQDTGELLQRFTSQFKDEYKLAKGSVIDISREQDHILRTKINGTEVGVIQSKLLGRSVLDLYIGDNPIDNNAKEEVEFQGASLFQNKMIGNETRFGM